MKKFISIFVCCCIICFEATAGGTQSPHLCIRDCNSLKMLLKVPVEYGRSFTIRYIHSVDISPVFEVFRVKKGIGLVLEETYFRMFGAGMGHWQGHGQLVYDGKWTRIKEINDPVGSFILRIGSKGVDHTILLGSQAINLSEIAAGHRAEVFISPP